MTDQMNILNKFFKNYFLIVRFQRENLTIIFFLDICIDISKSFYNSERAENNPLEKIEN